MEKYFHGFLCIFIITFPLIHFVQAQDQEGFITLDCGLLPDGSPYTNPSTGLIYTSDSIFIQSGKNSRVSKDFERNFEKSFLTLRYFPDGERNCYNLKVTQGTNYLIRASFLYGNYDGNNTVPNFDIFVGPNKWTTLSLNETGGGVHEMIHMSRSSSLHICLVKTGSTTPMISTLELRPLRSDIYVTATGSSLHLRLRSYNNDLGLFLRYPDDVYDRRWLPNSYTNLTIVTTTLSVNTTNGYDPPQGAMASAATSVNDNGTLEFSWKLKDSTTRFHIYLHFAELQTLLANETREFNVLLNGNIFNGPFSPKKLSIVTMITQPESTLRCEGGICKWQLVKTAKSTLPPLINAFELYDVVEFPQSETNQDEVNAIKKIQTAYGLSRISWQGDPCVPTQFLWAGLKCSNTDNSSTPPTVTFLNLSSSGLTGIIASSIQNLTHLEELDLSNNYLEGHVPEFLADMKALLIINLSGNNLSGQLPQKLEDKKGLKLNVEGNNKLLCSEGPCVNKSGEGGHPKKNIIVPVVASVSLMVVLISGLVLFFVLRKKNSSMSEAEDRTGRTSEPPRITKKKRFTYAEVTEMTNNFERVLGKGGFGMVYHGYVNGTDQVAVKVLSQASTHGHKQFKAEVELLLRVHHKNLVNLVGYCEEGEELALVYEYMANGDLQEFLSGKRGDSILSWGTRLQIALEAAQGLEYLHKGCRPAIVHRDVKTANILLDEHFQTKLADFGLSRSFLNEGESHVSTVVAGTMGYLDPEYYNTNWLTEKSDVYSFGVVLLEIITNQPVIDQTREIPYIAKWVGLMVTNGDIRKIVDPSLHGDYHSDSVWKFVELAMTCVNDSSTARPTMSQVVIELIKCIKSENSGGGTSQSIDSKGSREVTMTFDTDVNPMAR